MSKLEVDAIEPQSGTTLTIGASGDSVNIASGATITDFKSTGIDDNATSTAITIDSSERVGIGTTSPASQLHVNDASNARIKITAGTSNDAQINFGDSGDDDIGMINYDNAQNSMKFVTNTLERMRIDSSGNLIIGATSIPLSGSTVNGVQLRGGSDLNYFSTDTTASQEHMRFINPNGRVGSIRTTGSSTAYNTSSDYRLKENVSYDFDATTRLKQLKPARFNFIADADTTVDGFLAHEVSSVVPEAITGTHNETETKQKVVVESGIHIIEENIEQADWEAGKIPDENGNTKYPTDSTWEATKVVPVYQSIDQSKLVPLLTGALQEAIAKIESLEARITALETN